jgi:crotonobetainyl-CoA:carnitine CoA-transferase CaiB-like acyl-CoA transferase
MAAGSGRVRPLEGLTVVALEQAVAAPHAAEGQLDAAARAVIVDEDLARLDALREAQRLAEALYGFGSMKMIAIKHGV